MRSPKRFAARRPYSLRQLLECGRPLPLWTWTNAHTLPPEVVPPSVPAHVRQEETRSEFLYVADVTCFAAKALIAPRRLPRPERRREDKCIVMPLSSRNVGSWAMIVSGVSPL